MLCARRLDFEKRAHQFYARARFPVIVKKGMNEVQFGKQLSHDWQLSMHVENANKIYVTPNANFPEVYFHRINAEF